MVKYRCNVCKVFEYDTDRGDSPTNIKPGTNLKDFPDDWKCPICKSDKTNLREIKEEKQEIKVQGLVKCPNCGTDSYLGEWKRESDDVEKYMEYIHKISSTGESIIEPMRTKHEVISWEDILIKGAQLSKIPLNQNQEVNTKTIIGPKSKKPLIIETPIYVTHMSFGALSKEIKIALSKGSAAFKKAICSGEVCLLKESLKNSYKYIYEYVPNEYSFNQEII